MIDKMGSSEVVEIKSMLKDLSETIKAKEKQILCLPASGETEDIEEEPPILPAHYPSVVSDVFLEETQRLKDQGDQLTKESKWQEALNCYSEGLKYQEHRILYFNRAVCHFNLGEYLKTIADCTDALRLDEKYEKAYFRRAKAKEKLNDYYGACIDFQSSLISSLFKSRASWEAFTLIKPRALDDFYSRINVKNGRELYELDTTKEDGTEAHPGTPRRELKKIKNSFELKYPFAATVTRDITDQVVVGRSPNETAQSYRLQVLERQKMTSENKLFEEALKVLRDRR